MKKQTKLLLGLTVLGLAAYFYMKSKKATTTPKAALTGLKM